MIARCALLVAGLAILCNGLIVHAAEPATNQNSHLPGISKSDWPWWRGPQRDGIADADQSPPVEFGESKNVSWKVAVVGRGHGAPSVVGSRVFLTAADEEKQVQWLLCFDRNSGDLKWKKAIHEGNFIKGGNNKSSHASSTPACDGERVYVNFANNNGVYTTAVTVDGDQVWQKKVSDYVIHQGYGASPAIYGPLVIVMADNKGGGAVAGLNRASGEVVWRQDRPKLPNYPSPTILKINGKDQVLLTGCDLVTSYDPLTGKKNWEYAGATTECVTTTVTDGKHIFTSGGYPKNHISAVVADGSGKVDWENNVRVYVPSMLIHNKHLILVTDNGVAMCRNCDTGKELWNLRLGGTFDASPVIVGDKLYLINEAGEAFVLKITDHSFEKLAENKVGDEAYSTPTICGGQIFLRVASQVDGKRQESLYCFTQK